MVLIESMEVIVQRLFDLCQPKADSRHADADSNAIALLMDSKYLFPMLIYHRLEASHSDVKFPELSAHAQAVCGLIDALIEGNLSV